ncbi:MAG: 4-alpha-glucanotransferase [Salinicola sp.]|uniref:4-alpha-glucanotransferase n=1 Tax=Salinicola sp. TaxID=1978524 RepID=UPI001D723C0D|nr:4-alpha-glucanotransferase [Salinicola sp.]NRB55904.1 4-alpha-glucanotransferase [Salinicola sp.]
MSAAPTPGSESGDMLHQLAAAVGLLLEWVGSNDQRQTLPADRQRAMLTRLGWPAGDDEEVAASLARWRSRQRPGSFGRLPPMLLADQGQSAPVPVAEAGGSAFTVRFESGELLEGRLDAAGHLPPMGETGYHSVSFLTPTGDESVTRILAVAPSRCFTLDDIARERRDARASYWGVAAQLYGLRRDGDGGIGDLVALDDLCETVARAGADAVAISPLHALFAAHPERYSPYSPSSRLFYNVWHASPECLFDDETLAWARAPFSEAMEQQSALALIDWPASARLKLSMLERLFLHVQRDESALAWRSQLVAFRRDGGDSLERHCRFEVLQAQAKCSDWRQWSEAWRDPGSDAVEAFAEQHREAITFAVFLQWLMAAGLDRVQHNARRAGMAVGLIADLAVGVDPAGSQAWSDPHELFQGLTVGSPPDAFNAQGQGWGVAAFSPEGLVDSGYRGFLAMLRAGLAHAGGLRIDHILGLSRLWLVPEGESPQRGAYLRYPLDDLLRLVALESWRHRAIVIGEDLGTVEADFRERLAAKGILGMSVMWFEREGDAFLPADAWREHTLATTSTHDLPTVAGWWRENDLRWRERLGWLEGSESHAHLSEQRREDRRRLALVCGLGEVVADDGIAGDRVDVDDLIDAALGHVASTPTPLALFPLEDLMGLEEQANLPGTVDEHPNWRRRLPVPAPQALEARTVRQRLTRIDRIRRGRRS